MMFIEEKIWHESLDLINKNLSDMLGCISKLERTMNQMGLKQDTLISLVNLTNDLISTNKVEPTPSEKKRPDITFSKFSPCLASFDLDPPNIIDSCHRRYAEPTKFMTKFPPTVVVKLLQYSGSRVEHRDGFSSYKRFVS